MSLVIALKLGEGVTIGTQRFLLKSVFQRDDFVLTTDTPEGYIGGAIDTRVTSSQWSELFSGCKVRAPNGSNPGGRSVRLQIEAPMYTVSRDRNPANQGD